MARRWLIGLALLLLVLAGGLAAAALSFDPNGQKARIAEAVYRATGRQLTLAGPMRVSWGLKPTIEAEDVALANMPGGSRPDMATVGRLEARIALLPLLSRHVDIVSVTLIHPDILLETDAQGRGNWRFMRPAAAPGPVSAPSSGPRTVTTLDSLRVTGGHVTWRNGVTGQSATADLPDAVFDLGDGPSHLLAQAQLAGTGLTIDATLGDWAQITGEQPGPWPVKTTITAGGATATFDGAADPAARSLSGRVTATIPDLAALGVVVQRPDLPPLHDVHLAATLPGLNALPTDVSLQVGRSDLGALLSGAVLDSLNLAWTNGQPARLQANGTLAGGPWQVTTGLAPAGLGVALRAMKITSPAGDLAGDLALLGGARPAVRGTVVSNRIDADAIRSLLRRPAAPVSQPANPATPAAPLAAPGPLFSDAPLPWDLLRHGDGDISLTIGDLHFGGADYRNVAAHAVLQDGLLKINPASVQAPEGHIDLSASADAGQPAPSVILNLRSAAFALGPLLQPFGLPGASDASAELDVALQASGVSPRALAASLTGHAGIALVDGEVSNADLTAAFGGLLRSAGAAIDDAGKSLVRCLALRADAKGGVVTLSALKLDSSRLALNGGGTIDLTDETMALRLKPLLRIGSAGVAAPVRVDGPLRHPAVALDKMDAAGRVGLTIGGLAGPPDDCAPELTAARDGRTGRLPAAGAAAKQPKAADLLKSLLR